MVILSHRRRKQNVLRTVVFLQKGIKNKGIWTGANTTLPDPVDVFFESINYTPIPFKNINLNAHSLQISSHCFC